MKKKTPKKNSSNRKLISLSTEFRLDINLKNLVRKLCSAMINVFQETFCYALHLFKRDYSTGGNFCHFCHFCYFLSFLLFLSFLSFFDIFCHLLSFVVIFVIFLSFCHFLSWEGRDGEGREVEGS